MSRIGCSPRVPSFVYILRIDNADERLTPIGRKVWVGFRRAMGFAGTQAEAKGLLLIGALRNNALHPKWIRRSASLFSMAQTTGKPFAQYLSGWVARRLG